jgi:hypothetical protein
MPRKSARQTGVEFIGIVLIVILAALAVVFRFIVENPWILALVVAVAGVAIWSFAREKRRREAIAQEEREQEEKRLQELQAELEELERRRVQEILSYSGEWGDDTCQKVVEKKISLGMTSEMVKLAVGEPTSIDNKVITERDENFRWVYGTPRYGATYVWFRDGKVTKIKQ